MHFVDRRLKYNNIEVDEIVIFNMDVDFHIAELEISLVDQNTLFG